MLNRGATGISRGSLGGIAKNGQNQKFLLNHKNMIHKKNLGKKRQVHIKLLIKKDG